MRYRELLSVRGIFLLLFVGLVLVNRYVLRDHVLWSIRRWSLLLSFCLGGGFGCEDVLSEISLLDKIFKVLTGRSALRSSMSLVAVEGTVVSHFGASRVVFFLSLNVSPKVDP